MWFEVGEHWRSRDVYIIQFNGLNVGGLTILVLYCFVHLGTVHKFYYNKYFFIAQTTQTYVDVQSNWKS